MNDIDITDLILEKNSKSYPRTRGRYSASEIYAIFAGWTPAEKWLKPDPKDAASCIKMWKGTMAHEHIQNLLKNGVCEPKKEHKYKDITLVGKADFLPDDTDAGWEIKTSEEIMPKAKAWHEHQAKLYCTMFQRPSFLILQPAQTEDRVFLKNVGVVYRDDEWFLDQMIKLHKFHLTRKR